MSSPTDRFLIICGAEKAGTTSLFGYLAAHPRVAASVRKETDYFRQPDVSLMGYMGEFETAPSAEAVYLESSPGYLAEAESVAPRMAAVVPQARLVFVLRDPVDRLRSAYRFYLSRLHVPGDMDFGRFVTACLDHEFAIGNDDVGRLRPWHLLAAARGRYERLLPVFEPHFPASQRLIVAHRSLQADAAGTTRAVARFAGLDPAPFEDLAFARQNVTFAVRNRGIQRLAVQVNDNLEGLWRRFPELKRRLLAAYKRINSQPLPSDELPDAVQARLDAYYRPTRQFLAEEQGDSASPVAQPVRSRPEEAR